MIMKKERASADKSNWIEVVWREKDCNYNVEGLNKNHVYIHDFPVNSHATPPRNKPHPWLAKRSR